MIPQDTLTTAGLAAVVVAVAPTIIVNVLRVLDAIAGVHAAVAVVLEVILVILATGVRALDQTAGVHAAVEVVLVTDAANQVPRVTAGILAALAVALNITTTVEKS
jgi:hypothetical protein